jgi:hypothetical protein
MPSTLSLKEDHGYQNTRASDPKETNKSCGLWRHVPTSQFSLLEAFAAQGEIQKGTTDIPVDQKA